MDKILKQLREEAKLTQEAVADKLGFSVNSIQNWEKTGKITKESLHSLLDLYGVNNMMRTRVVLSVFGDDFRVEKNIGVDNFPYFLFVCRPDIVSAARKAILSPEEMELFGYSYYMNSINASNSMFERRPKRWPMDYSVFKDHGGYFSTIQIIHEIEAKIGNYMGPHPNEANLSMVVYHYGMTHHGVGFTYCSLSKEEIAQTIYNLPIGSGDAIDISNLYFYCDAVREPVCIGTDTTSYLYSKQLPRIITEIVNKRDSLQTQTVEYELQLTDVSSKCFEIEKKEFNDKEYNEKKDQYLLDKKAYEAHPGLYDREPTFDFHFFYFLTLTDLGCEYLEWFESTN